MKKNIFKWKKGAGSEILAVVITICTLFFLGYIVVLFGSIYSEMQSQIVADIVADGAVAYAKTNMNVAEIPLNKMATKIYEANVGLNSGVTLGELGSPKIMPIHTLSDSQKDKLFSNTENLYLKPRAQLMSGSLPTVIFKQIQLPVYKNLQTLGSSGVYEGLEDIKDDTTDTYSITYRGPKYLDEIVVVEVSSSYDLPLVSSLTTKTKQSVELFTALVPYNSRSSADVSTKRHNIIDQIETKAFEECELNDADKGSTNPNVPKYGSIQQKALLEAKRYVGEGYARGSLKTTASWPSISSKINFGSYVYVTADEATNGKPVTESPQQYTSANSQNTYKDCEEFVNVCFNFDNSGGLSEALGKYPHTSKWRTITYKRTISAKDIWKEMHPETTTVTGAGKNKIDWEEDGTKKVNGWTFRKTNTYCSLLKGSKKYGILRSNTATRELNYSDGWKFKGTTVNNGSKIVYEFQKGEPVSLADEVLKYANPGIPIETGGGTDHIWEIETVEEWSKDMLQVGDVLIFYNPNRCDFVLPELVALANAEKETDIDFSQFDEPSRFICHYAIYFGDGKVIECSGSTSWDPEGAISINPIKGVGKEDGVAPGNNTMVLAGIIRFTNEGNLTTIELPHMDE